MKNALLLLVLSLSACSSSSSSQDTQSQTTSEAVLCPEPFAWKQGECVLKEVYIAGGTFTMGRGRCPVATPLEEDPGTECPLTDLPQQVTVPPFFIDAAPSRLQRFPCTKERCEIPVYNTPPPGSGLPDAGWGWPLEATLSEEGELNKNPCNGQEKRLIREDEWEFVVTAGGTRTYPWGDDTPSCDKLWLGFDSGCALLDPLPDLQGLPLRESTRYLRTLAHPPSPEGIYDLVHYVPHLVLPREDLYNESYAPTPYEFLVPFDSHDLAQPPGCPTYNCYGYHTQDGPECGERCKVKRYGARGGRQQHVNVVKPDGISFKYERSQEAYKGYVRGLIFRERALLAHCVRDAP